MYAILLSIGALILVSIIWFLGKDNPRLKHLPTIKGWPILGNILQINYYKPEMTFAKWSKELGGVFVVQLLNQTFVILNSYEAIYDALVTNGEKFAGRTKVTSFRHEYFSRGCQDIFFGNPNPKWRLMRKTVHTQVKMYGQGLKHLEELNASVIRTLIDGFLNHNGKPFDPLHHIYNATMNIMTSLLVKRKYDMNDKLFKAVVQMDKLTLECMKSSGRGYELDVFPWLRYFGNPVYKKLQQQRLLLDEAWEIVKKIVLEDLAKNSEEGLNDGLIHTLMRMQENQKDTPGQVKLQEVNTKMIFLDMIMAGTVTTTNTFYAFLNILCNHPELQQKLADEVAGVVGFNQTVSLDDRKNMPYTHATLLELLRYSSVAALGIVHCTLVETSVCGLVIPEGVQALNNLWGLHHDEDFWDEPFKFKPERFLGDGELLSASHENRRHLMLFGAGSRVCLGEVLAMGRLFQLIATTAQLLEVSPGPEKVSCDCRDYVAGSVLTPPEFKICVQHRTNFKM